MNSEPLVSVLMTAYNREQYIAEAIESVLVSTYKNFELIIVDDLSKDNTVSIARKYETGDERIKVYVNTKNLGDYNNRNKAASLAKGKYLKYLDSDDVIYPHALQIMAEAMEKFPIAAYGFCYRHVQNNKYKFPYSISPVEAYNEHFFQGGLFYAGPGSSIILKKYFDEVGGFTGKRFIGDYELWLKLSSKYSAVVFQSGLIWWRVHEGQEFDVGHKTSTYILENLKCALYYLNSDLCPLPGNKKLKAIRNQKALFNRQLLKLFFLKGQYKLAWSIFREAKLPLLSIVESVVPYNKIERLKQSRNIQ